MYAAEPEEFTARRQRLVASARAAGDKEAAQRIGGLRKPTRAAWLVNRLVRAQPEVPVQLAMVADGLRSAAHSRDGARLRELSGARSALVDEFTTRALAGIPDPAASLREDVAGTLEAAIADPSVAAELSAGALTRAVRYAGFGADAGSDLSPLAADAASALVADAATGTAAATHLPATRTPSADAPASAAEPVPLRVTTERQQLREAERAVANAATLAESAEEDESRLEDLVRDLEQRLVTAREELATARLRSRRAEAAERKARQALDRLRPPGEGHAST